LEKRSLTIAGHRTSVALEPEFWDALEVFAASRGISATALIREVDAGRSGTNLSSAIRVAILLWTQDRAAQV
jgi:predicted DNA-binding ribbon-helix-helix protein